MFSLSACLKNHFRNLQAPLCGIFYPHSVAVARYAALIRIKSPTNWDSQLTKSLFQTRALDQGRDVMLEIDVQGAQQIYAKRPDAVRIFLAPPSWSELERRLVNRGTDSADKIRQRLTRARDEMALAVDYDYFIINDDVERAAAELNDIFRVEHFKPAERMHLVKD